MTLDGVMQAPGNPEKDRDGGFDQGGWSLNYRDGMIHGLVDSAMATDHDLLLGRRTYEIFHARFPKANDPVATWKFNRATRFVVTQRPETALWENNVEASRDPAAELAALKARDGPDPSISGSATLVQLLLTHGLVDQFQLWVLALALSTGKRLFGAGTVPTGLKLESSVASATGMLVLDYVKADRAASRWIRRQQAVG